MHGEVLYGCGCRHIRAHIGIAQPEVESYTGKYLRIKAAVTNQEPEKVPEELAALDFSLAVGSVVLVDYDYLTQLIQDWIDEQQQYTTPDQAQAHMTDYLQNSAKVQASLNKFVPFFLRVYEEVAFQSVTDDKAVTKVIPQLRRDDESSLFINAMVKLS